jgi:putative transposase
MKAKRKGKAGKKWHGNETYLKVKGHWWYLYWALDQFGNLVDVRLSKMRDLKAAEAFFKQSLQTGGHKPEKVTTDKHTSYPSYPESATAVFTKIELTTIRLLRD